MSPLFRRSPAGTLGRPERRPTRPASLTDAIIALTALVVLIAGSLLLFGLDALDGPIQVALLLCCMIVALLALKNGVPWEQVSRPGRARWARSPQRCSSCWRSAL